MLINMGPQKYQHGTCQCGQPTNLLWNETVHDFWIHACSEECAKIRVETLLNLRLNRENPNA